MTQWREQRGMDSYQPRQISQSDCEISSNCGKIKYYLNNALNSAAEHSSDSILLAPCFPAVERPFFPTIENNNILQ